MASTVYLDHAASTPLDPEVLEAMLPWLAGSASAGNPSSIHSSGRAARAAIDLARESVAELLGADFSEITFTSGGTEADNLAVLGVAAAENRGRRRAVTTAIEHHAVLHAMHRLTDRGWDVVTIAPDETGHIPESAWQRVVDNQTALIACMHANNELGTVQQLQAATAVAATTGALLHVDAVQSLPWLKVDVRLQGFDLCAVSAHKIYGPKGVGALYVRQGTAVAPQIVGGSQEREKRAGTENVAGIVGFGMAARLLQARRDSDAARVRELRMGHLETLLQEIPGLHIHGSGDLLPNILNFAIDGVEGPTLLMNLDRAGICASSGAACSSGSIEPSHVLRALGFSATEAASGVRLSLGRTTTTDDIDHACTMIREIANRVRSA